MNIITTVFIFIATLFGLGLGAQIKTESIGNDCEKLGAFRVGNKVFICEVKK